MIAVKPRPNSPDCETSIRQAPLIRGRSRSEHRWRLGLLATAAWGISGRGTAIAAVSRRWPRPAGLRSVISEPICSYVRQSKFCAQGGVQRQSRRSISPRPCQSEDPSDNVPGRATCVRYRRSAASSWRRRPAHFNHGARAAVVHTWDVRRAHLCEAGTSWSYILRDPPPVKTGSSSVT